MERGRYRFDISQIVMGDNGEYKIIKREKKKDATKKAIQRKWYTLLCPNGHEYLIEESHLEMRIIRCSSCYHPKIKDVDPDFAAMFVNKEYPSIYTCMSHVKADFYCKSCGKICENKSIHTVYQRGYVPCKFCGDGRSYGERVFATILDNLELIYTFQKRIEWEGTKFYYDFELHNSNILFEVHGIQHYERGFEAIGGRSLEEEKQNDLLKKNIAKKYGYRVIEIDAKKSTIKYIREELERNEELKEIIDVQAIDWDFVKRASMITRDTLMLEMLKKGEDKQKIAQKFGISQASIPEIKKRFIDDGLWDGISVGDKIKKEEEKKLIATIEEMWNEGMKSGDICKILCLSNDRFKRLMQLDVFPDPKRVEKWTDEEAEKVIKAKDLPIELVSGFIDRRTNAVWKCKHCGTFFKATLIGLETGPKCPQCKGYEKVEQHLSKNFPGEYEIRSLYSASDTYMKFLHLVCGNEFYRTPHSIKRSIIPCIVCAEKYRIIKASRQK